MIFLLLSLLVALLDQLSKGYITSHFHLGQSISLLGDFLKITYIQNPGGVFGTKIGSGNFYTFISLVAILIVLLVYFRMINQKATFKIALGLILGGAIGNLIDRFRFGQVVDFLDVDFFNINLPPFKFLFLKFNGFYLDRWPVFNLADSAVTVGLIILIYHFSFQGAKN
ncbi:MAG: signal peptidase II [candidate division Zixibacteria bacterium]|nr:signal peptidase II [candidate division Zixibacteria bacterium]